MHASTENGYHPMDTSSSFDIDLNGYNHYNDSFTTAWPGFTLSSWGHAQEDLEAQLLEYF